MARDHARLLYRIWSEDDDFINLRGLAQRLYMLIISQPTLSYAGVTSYTVRRWTRLASDTPDSAIRDAAQQLAEARFIVVDEETEEVFVRTYVRNDNILSNPNVAIASARAYRQISSRTIRAAWIDELKRLHSESEAAGTLEKAWTDPKSSKLLADLLAEPAPKPPSAQVSALLKGGSEPPSERGSSEGGSEGGLPTRACTTRAAPAPSPSPAPSPLLPTRPPSTADAPTDTPAPNGAARTDTQRSKVITDAYRAAEPMSKWPAINGIVLTAIRAGTYSDDEIRAAMLRLAAAHRTVTVETLRVELAGDKRPRNGSSNYQPYLNDLRPGAYDEYQLHGKPGDDELS